MGPPRPLDLGLGHSRSWRRLAAESIMVDPELAFTFLDIARTLGSLRLVGATAPHYRRFRNSAGAMKLSTPPYAMIGTPVD